MKTQQQDEKQVSQTAVRKTASPSLKRVGTIYGSSLLKTLQTPRRLQQNQAAAAQPAPVQTQVQGTSLLTGKSVPLKQTTTGPQLCLKFAKVTRPDGKPGLTAIIEANPSKQQGVSPKGQVIQPKVIRQQQNTTQISLPTSPPKKIANWPNRYKKKRSKAKSVPLPTDETQQAVAGLNAYENVVDSGSRARGLSVETRREPNNTELAKTEKLLKVLRNLETRQREKSRNQQNSEVSPQQNVQSTSTEHLSERAIAERQLQRMSSRNVSTVSIKKELIENEVAQPLVAQPNRPLAHQLPPDDDPLGLGQSSARKKTKKPAQHTQKKNASTRHLSPKATNAATAQKKATTTLPQLEDISERAREERAAREFPAMINNIDVFMFQIYRCKLCPNYYSTVKTTIVEHMRDFHRWMPQNTDSSTGAEGDGENEVEDSVQDRVKNIQNIFEMKLRNQAIGGNLELGVELEHVSTSVRKSSDGNEKQSSDKRPTAIESIATDQRDGRQSSDENQMDNNDDDDDNDDDFGGFEDDNDDDDDDYDGGGVDDHEVESEMKADTEGTEKSPADSMSTRKSPRFVKHSSTPMIRNYPHRKISSTECLKDAEEEGQCENDVNQKLVEESASKESSKKAKKRAKKGESSDEDIVDNRNLDEVRPKKPSDYNNQKKNPPKKKLTKYQLRRRKRELYYKCEGMQRFKRRKEERLRAENNEEKNGDSGENVVIAETQEENIPSEAATIGVGAARRPTTRSVAKSQDGLEETVDSPSRRRKITPVVKKRISMSRYEAWKKIGLDPNSEPPWLCTIPGCNTYFTEFGSIIIHYSWKHDFFGDRDQRILARRLGEKYSLFEKREKRAVKSASSDSSEDEVDEGDSTPRRVRGKSKRNKKAPQRFEMPFTTHPRKTIICKYCKGSYAEASIRCHQRYKHTKRWMADNSLTVDEVAEFDKKRAARNARDATTSNISLLADVAVDGTTYQCNKCSYKAQTDITLKKHKNWAHPEYVKSMYSDSENEEDEPSEPKEDRDEDEGRTSARPVRHCRRKRLSDMMEKERKLDKVVPEILPDHAIYGRVLEEVDERELEDEVLDRQVLQCQECNFMAITHPGFVSHMKIIHGQDIELKIQCEHCEFVGTKKEISYHAKRLHSPPILCEACGKPCKGQRRLERHQQLYCGKNVRSYAKWTRTCNICGRIYHSESGYCYHMKGHKNETHNCDICQKSFTRKTLLQNHMKSHTEGKLSCEHCDYKGHYKSDLRDHMFIKHNIGEENMPMRKCGKCTFESKNPLMMIRHHTQHRRTEGRTRRRNKPYKYYCDICNQRVKTLSCLARHQVVHRDGRDVKFKCDICGYQSTCKNTLRTHKLQKHVKQAKDIMCTICGEGFNKPSELKNHHIRIHMDGKPIKCKAEGCDLTFKYHAQRNKHFQNEHKDLAEAEETAKVEQARKIINAGPKVRKAREKKPRKKRVYPSKATGAKRGRPPLPLTPELIAHRQALNKARFKRGYDRRKAKMKRLGIKRKKYKKGESRSKQTTCRKKAAQRNFDEEDFTAAQQLENIAQSLTSDSQQHVASPQSHPPVKVEVQVNEAYGQPTALHDYASSSGDIPTTSTHIQPIRNQEIVVSSEMQAIEDLARTLAQSSQTQSPGASHTTQRLVQGIPTYGSPVHQGDQPNQDAKPVSFLEVTTTHSDGRSQVDRYPVWDK